MKEVLVGIIGAGPGGTTCAAMLEKLGIKSVLIERSQFPRFTIGESLLSISLDNFEEAGLLDAVLASDLMKKPGAVFHDGRQQTQILFSETNNLKHKHALSVERVKFDSLLSDAVISRGIEIKWKTTLVGACYDNGWELELENEGEKSILHADFVVDASGAAIIVQLVEGRAMEPTEQKHTAVFAQLEDPNRPEGFEEGATWILTNDLDVWGWLIPFASGVTSIGFIGTEEKMSTYGDSASDRFSNLLTAFPVASDRFGDRSFVRKPAGASNYKRKTMVPSGEGYCLVGNSIGFLDPVFSSGVAVATHSAIRAAHAIHKHFGEENIDWKKEYDSPLLSGINVFSDCVEAWYDGTLPLLIHNQRAGKDGGIHPTVRQINSILAGGVWDKSNPLTNRTARILRVIASGIS